MSWYETAFRKEYLDVYYRRDEESAKEEAAFTADALGLPGSCRVLDVACGSGRHARALAGMGYEVVGVDLSRDLLALATDVRCVRADMRALPFAGSFDAATSFFTSFGYFDDAGNRATLASVAAALRPGGAYLLDFLNATAVRLFLVPENEEERDGRTYRFKRRIENDRIEKDVVIEEDGVTLSYTESVRLYNHHELLNLLRENGLNPIASYGAFDGRDYTTEAPRCIVVARRV